MEHRNMKTCCGVAGRGAASSLKLLQGAMLLLGVSLAPLAGAQVASEYGTLAAKQGGAAAAAPVPAMKVAAVSPAAAKKGNNEIVGSGAALPNCVGDIAAPTAVNVAVGKSMLLRLPEPVIKRTIGNPGIVETRLVSAQTLYVLGMQTGATNMILQGKGGRCLVVDVAVGFDGGGLEAKIHELFPGESNVKVSAAADSLVLSGTVSDALVANQIVMLANAYVRTGMVSPTGGPTSSASTGSTSMGSGTGAQVISPRVVNMMSVASPQQVMLEVKIAEVSKTLLEKLGAQTGFSTTSGAWTYSIMSSFLFGAGGVLGAVKNPNNLIKLDGEDKDELVKILAEPTVMAISGQEGSFLAGGKIFIPVAQSGGFGGTGTITLEEKEFGVGLRFTPTVLAGGRINLKVAPEVSEVNPEGIGIAINTGLLTGTSILPSITTRRAATTVQLFDGQTFAIGGLIKNNVKQSVKQFPFLGDIPILGALFRSNSFQNDRTELLFVVTPRLVKPMPPDYKLPTDAYVPPNRADQVLFGEMEGSRPKAEPSSPAAKQGAAAEGFEVK